MMNSRLDELIDEKVKAAHGEFCGKLPNKTAGVVIRHYKFPSTIDYRNFFNSLSPEEATCVDSPIPTEIHPETDGTVIIDFRLPS